MAKNKKEEQGLPISAMELEQPWPPVLFRGFSAFTTEESVAITAATNSPADFTGFSPRYSCLQMPFTWVPLHSLTLCPAPTGAIPTSISDLCDWVGAIHPPRLPWQTPPQLYECAYD